MLRLSEVKKVLEGINIESTAYFNKKSNEILWKWDFNPKYSTYKEDDEYNDDIICMFDFSDKNDYGIMQAFIDTMEDLEIKQELYAKTKGSGAFKRFRYILDDYGLTDKWYQYMDEKYKEIAREWCISNNIEFEEDC